MKSAVEQLKESLKMKILAISEIFNLECPLVASRSLFYNQIQERHFDNFNTIYDHENRVL